MKFQDKALLNIAGGVLGLSMLGSVQATSVVSIKIEDVGSTVAVAGGVCDGIDNSGCIYSPVLDSLSGGFNFFPLDPTTYAGTSLWTGDIGDGTIDLTTANPINSFTTGFLFVGFPFLPSTHGPSVGDITGTTLTWDNFSFGGTFGTTDFFLGADSGTMNVNWVVPTSNPNEFLVQFQFSHLITPEEDLNFNGATANWLLEGTMTTSVVPVPAAVWLFGSGLVGLVGVARRKARA